MTAYGRTPDPQPTVRRGPLSNTARQTATIPLALTFVLAACSERTDAPGITAPPTNAAASVAPGVAAFPGFILIPPLPGPAFATASAEAYGVNNARIVVGRSDRTVVIGGTTCTTSAAFMFNTGTGLMTDLLLPLGLPLACSPLSVALDINNANVVVGWAVNGAGSSAFIWAGGTPTILASAALKTVANAINDAGVTVGFINDPAIGKHAVKWIGPFAQIDIHPAGWATSEAVDIDNAGIITGVACTPVICHVGKWTPGGAFVATPKVIGQNVATLAGNSVRPLSVNNALAIAGTETIGGADAPFSWKGGVFGAPAAPPTRVAEVSDLGRAVGSTTSAAGLRTAYTRRAGILAALPGPPGIIEMWATGVNTCGDVVGTYRVATKRLAIFWPNIPCD